jgi:antitoxin component HigA of HigAB toxin-antitoxin module
MKQAPGKTARMARGAPNDSYLTLVLECPLRPIRTRADYGRASKMLDRLAVRGESTLDAGERDYLDVLTDLVEAYDDAHAEPIRRGSLRERVAHLMSETGLTQAQFARLAGVRQPMASMVLSGQRELSKASIARLARHFAVRAEYFMP